MSGPPNTVQGGRSFLWDIRPWILLLLLVRLIGITQPPLETAHHWRQTTVTMTARNFHEHGLDLLHPRVDMAGEKSGITGMEVPLLAAGIAVIADLFGYTHWYGRLISLLLCSAGLLAFHRLVSRYVDRDVAFWATHLLGVSLWFTYGRKIMPDVPSTALVIIGTCFASRALDGLAPLRNTLLAALFLALGTAMKLPAGYLLAILPVMVLGSTATTLKRWRLLGLVGLFQLPVLWWYFRWVPHLEELGGFRHFFMGATMSQGLQELAQQPLRTLDNFYFDAMRFSGMAATVAGLVLTLRHRERFPLIALGLATVAFGVVMLKAGSAFWKHAYYVVPFVPVMAVLAGYAVNRLPRRSWQIAAVVLIAAEGLLSQWQDFRLNPVQAPLLGLERDLDRLGPRSELLVVNSGAIPTPLYFAHRKGWTAYAADLERGTYLDSLAGHGADYVLQVYDGYERPVPLALPVVLNTAHYTVFALDRRRPSSPAVP